ncbi:MAG TPA: hypothetical protein VMM12_07925 [Longimicrobiales bacterium]|nr:hypothetical protein [Longimicrobiales bacterium]
MARYDRIARIAAPAREDCFRGWLTLRDIDGREREPELGRRARLRFLALRPVRRLLLRGLGGPAADSLQAQLDEVRREIDRLDARDPERDRLMAYLAEAGGRSPLGLATATLEVGAAAEGAGHRFAAEEFYRTGLELAREHDLPAHQVRALRRIARVHRGREEWDRAVDVGHEAASLADSLGEPVQWARAMDEVARAESARGNRDAARAILEAVAARGVAAADRLVRAVAAGALCDLELAAGNVEAALREGLAAVELFPVTDPHRNAALLAMAAALRRVGLWSAAEACYGVVETHSTWVEHRAEAATERAVLAAELGDTAAFTRRRARILRTLESGDLRLRALLHLGLGRGCLVAGHVDHAREHLRQAIASARDGDMDTLLDPADALLHALEAGKPLPRVRPGPASAASRALAEEITQRFGAEVAAGA